MAYPYGDDEWGDAAPSQERRARRRVGAYGDLETDEASDPELEVGRDRALPMSADDRESTDLRSPDFQLAEDESPDPSRFPLPEETQRALDALGAESSGRRLTLDEHKELMDRGFYAGSGPGFGLSEDVRSDPFGRKAKLAEGRREDFVEGARRQQEDAAKEYARQQKAEASEQKRLAAGQLRYLKDQGVETAIEPDGSERVVTHEDGRPKFKAGWASKEPEQDETGAWVRPWRDERGNVQAKRLADSPGLYDVDANGRKGFWKPDGTWQDIGESDAFAVLRNLSRDEQARAGLETAERRRAAVALKARHAEIKAQFEGAGRYAGGARLRDLIERQRESLAANPGDKNAQKTLDSLQARLESEYPGIEPKLAERDDLAAKADALDTEISMREAAASEYAARLRQIETTSRLSPEGAKRAVEMLGLLTGQKARGGGVDVSPASYAGQAGSTPAPATADPAAAVEQSQAPPAPKLPPIRDLTDAEAGAAVLRMTGGAGDQFDAQRQVFEHLAASGVRDLDGVDVQATLAEFDRLGADRQGALADIGKAAKNEERTRENQAELLKLGAEDPTLTIAQLGDADRQVAARNARMSGDDGDLWQTLQDIDRDEKADGELDRWARAIEAGGPVAPGGGVKLAGPDAGERAINRVDEQRESDEIFNRAARLHASESVAAKQIDDFNQTLIGGGAGDMVGPGGEVLFPVPVVQRQIAENRADAEGEVRAREAKTREAILKGAQEGDLPQIDRAKAQIAEMARGDRDLIVIGGVPHFSGRVYEGIESADAAIGKALASGEITREQAQVFKGAYEHAMRVKRTGEDAAIAKLPAFQSWAKRKGIDTTADMQGAIDAYRKALGTKSSGEFWATVLPEGLGEIKDYYRGSGIGVGALWNAMVGGSDDAKLDLFEKIVRHETERAERTDNPALPKDAKVGAQTAGQLFAQVMPYIVAAAVTRGKAPGAVKGFTNLAARALTLGSMQGTYALQYLQQSYTEGLKKLGVGSIDDIKDPGEKKTFLLGMIDSMLASQAAAPLEFVSAEFGWGRRMFRGTFWRTVTDKLWDTGLEVAQEAASQYVQEAYFRTAPYHEARPYVDVESLKAMAPVIAAFGAVHGTYEALTPDHADLAGEWLGMAASDREKASKASAAGKLARKARYEQLAEKYQGKAEAALARVLKLDAKDKAVMAGRFSGTDPSQIEAEAGRKGGRLPVAVELGRIARGRDHGTSRRYQNTVDDLVRAGRREGEARVMADAMLGFEMMRDLERVSNGETLPQSSRAAALVDAGLAEVVQEPGADPTAAPATFLRVSGDGRIALAADVLSAAESNPARARYVAPDAAAPGVTYQALRDGGLNTMRGHLHPGSGAQVSTQPGSARPAAGPAQAPASAAPAAAPQAGAQAGPQAGPQAGAAPVAQAPAPAHGPALGRYRVPRFDGAGNPIVEADGKVGVEVDAESPEAALASFRPESAWPTLDGKPVPTPKPGNWRFSDSVDDVVTVRKPAQVAPGPPQSGQPSVAAPAPAGQAPVAPAPAQARGGAAPEPGSPLDIISGDQLEPYRWVLEKVARFIGVWRRIGLFERVVVVRGSRGGAPMYWSPEHRALVLNAEAIETETDARLARIVVEEALHEALDVSVEEGARLWNLLPRKMRADLLRAYPSLARKPARGESGERLDWARWSEWIRMVMQGRVGMTEDGVVFYDESGNQLTTEQVAQPESFRQAILDAIGRIVSAAKDLYARLRKAGASDADAAELRRVIAENERKLREIIAMARGETAPEAAADQAPATGAEATPAAGPRAPPKADVYDAKTDQRLPESGDVEEGGQDADAQPGPAPVPVGQAPAGGEGVRGGDAGRGEAAGAIAPQAAPVGQGDVPGPRAGGERAAGAVGRLVGGVEGKATTVIGRNNRQIPATFVAVPVESVQPSHVDGGKALNPDLDGLAETIGQPRENGWNTRQYHRSEAEREGTLRMAREWQPGLTVGTDQSAGGGLPVVVRVTWTGRDGRARTALVTAGGNGRVMAYRMLTPGQRAASEEFARERAADFGMRPEDLGPGTLPVRFAGEFDLRVPEQAQAFRGLVDDLNPTTQKEVAIERIADLAAESIVRAGNGSVAEIAGIGLADLTEARAAEIVADLVRRGIGSIDATRGTQYANTPRDALRFLRRLVVAVGMPGQTELADVVSRTAPQMGQATAEKEFKRRQRNLDFWQDTILQTARVCSTLRASGQEQMAGSLADGLANIARTFSPQRQPLEAADLRAVFPSVESFGIQGDLPGIASGEVDSSQAFERALREFGGFGSWFVGQGGSARFDQAEAEARVSDFLGRMLDAVVRFDPAPDMFGASESIQQRLAGIIGAAVRAADHGTLGEDGLAAQPASPAWARIPSVGDGMASAPFSLAAQPTGGRRWRAAEDPADLRAGEFVTDTEWERVLRDHYFGEGATGESSRTRPMRPVPLVPGMWMVSDMCGIYGHEVAQLRELDPADPRILRTEDMVETNAEGRGDDAERYAGWMRQGLTPPPIRVVETDKGNYAISDGHRRHAAALRAGMPVMAWVWPSMPVPSGARRSMGVDANGENIEGPVIKTGLTLQGVRAMKSGDVEAWRTLGERIRAEQLASGYKVPIPVEGSIDTEPAGALASQPAENWRQGGARGTLERIRLNVHPVIRRAWAEIRDDPEFVGLVTDPENWSHPALPGFKPRADMEWGERVMQADFARGVARDPDGTLARYFDLAEKDAQTRRYINTDVARTVYRPYHRDRNVRLLGNKATVAVADYIAHRMALGRLLDEARAAGGGQGTVMFLAGGPASGKTTTARTTAPEAWNSAAAIVDSTMSDQARAERSIEAVLDAGFEVGVYLVYRPFDEALVSSILRYFDEGRPVMKKSLLGPHASAPRVYMRMGDKYADDGRVQFRVIDNGRGHGNGALLANEDVENFLNSAYANLEDADEQERRAQTYDRETRSRLDPVEFAIFAGGTPPLLRESEVLAEAEGTREPGGGSVGQDARGESEPERSPGARQEVTRHFLRNRGLDAQPVTPAELVRRHMPMAQAIAGRFRATPAVGSEDLAQTARIALVRAAQALSPERQAEAASYLGRSVRNALVDLYRGERRRGAVATVSLDSPVGEGDGATALDYLEGVADVVADVARSERSALLREAVEALGGRRAEALRGVLQGSRYTRIASDMGVSVQAVHNLVNRSLPALRAELRARGVRGVDAGGMALGAQPALPGVRMPDATPEPGRPASIPLPPPRPAARQEQQERIDLAVISEPDGYMNAEGDNWPQIERKLASRYVESRHATSKWNRGWRTSTGRIVGPDEARRVAERAGQTLGEDGTISDAGLAAQSAFAPPRGKPARVGLPVNLVSAVARSWREAGLLVPVEVAPDRQGAARIAGREIPERVSGAYVAGEAGGKVILVAGEIEMYEGDTPKAAVARVLAHEGVGHFGVEAFVGREAADGIYRSVAESYARRGGAQGALRDQIARAYGEDPVVVGGEIVARLAEEDGASDPGFWRRVLAQFRRALRQALGLAPDDADIRALILGGRRAAMGRAGAERAAAALGGAAGGLASRAGFGRRGGARGAEAVAAEWAPDARNIASQLPSAVLEAVGWIPGFPGWAAVSGLGLGTWYARKGDALMAGLSALSAFPGGVVARAAKALVTSARMRGKGSTVSVDGARKAIGVALRAGAVEKALDVAGRVPGPLGRSRDEMLDALRAFVDGAPVHRAWLDGGLAAQGIGEATVMGAERIAAAAVRLADGRVLTGPFHAALGEDLSDEEIRTLTPGFVTSEGRFVDRSEAAEIGRAAGQVSPGEGGYDSQDYPELREAGRISAREWLAGGLAAQGIDPEAGDKGAERVVAAALKLRDGRVLTGQAHWMITVERTDIPDRMLQEATQGFTTSTGRFVTRDEGARIGRSAGQVRRQPTAQGRISEDFPHLLRERGWSDESDSSAGVGAEATAGALASQPVKARKAFYVGSVEIVRNPTPADRRQMAAEFRRTWPRSGDSPATRSTSDADGNVYIWRSDLGSHADIEPGIARIEGVDVNQHNANSLLSRSLAAQPVLPRNPAPDAASFTRIDQLVGQALAEVSGSRTIGDPRLAFAADDAHWMGLDEWRKATFQAQKEEEWRKAAEIVLARDYRGMREQVVARGLAGEALNPVETKAAQIIIVRESQDGRFTGPGAADLHMLVWAYRETGTAAARGMRSRVDPHRTPADRWREFAARRIFDPPPAVERAIRAAPSEAQKDQIIAGLRHRLEAAIRQANEMERRAIEADIAAEQAKATKEELLRRDRDGRVSDMIERLRRRGISVDDILGGKVDLTLVGAKIVGEKLNEVADVTDKRILALAQAKRGGATLEEVARKVGVPVERVRSVLADFRQRLKDEMREKVRAGWTAREGLDMGAVGALPLGAQSMDDLGGRELTDAQVEEELERMVNAMGFFAPDKFDKFRVRRRAQARQPQAPRESAPYQPAPTGPETGRFIAPSGPEQGRLGGTENPVPTGPTGTGQGRFIAPAGPEQGRLAGADPAVELAPTGPETGHFTMSGGPEQGQLGGTRPEYEAYSWDVADPDQRAQAYRALQAVEPSTFTDAVTEMGIANLLSGPVTFITNMLGYGYGAFDLFVRRAVESALNVRGSKDAEAWGEYGPAIRAFFGRLPSAWANARRAWTSEAPAFAEEALRMMYQPEFDTFMDVRFAPAIPDKLGPIGTEGGRSLPGAVAGLATGQGWSGVSVGRTVRLPMRALLAADEFFKTMFGAAYATDAAHRMARAQGLAGEDAHRFVAQQIGNFGTAAWTEGVRMAREVSFQKPLRNREQMAKEGESHLLGFFEGGMKWLQDQKSADLRGAPLHMHLGSLLLRMIAPFIRTPYRLAELGLALTPAGALYDLAHAGGRTASQRARSVALAATSFMLTALAYSAAEGDDDDDEKLLLITGSAPPDSTSKGLRGHKARTVPPYSIRIGGKDGIVIDYRRTDPFSTAIALVVDWSREFKKTRDGKDPAAAWRAIGTSLMDQLRDKTSLRGLSEMERMFLGEISPIEWGTRTAGSWTVPNLLRSGLRAADPVERDTRTEPLSASSVAHAFLPHGGISGAPARVDIAGREQVKRGSFLSRYLVPGNPGQQMERSAVDDWFVRYNASHPNSTYGPTPPQPTYTLDKVERKIPAREYNEIFLPLWSSLYVAGMRSEGLLDSPFPTDLDKQREISIRSKATREAKEILYGTGKRGKR